MKLSERISERIREQLRRSRLSDEEFEMEQAQLYAEAEGADFNPKLFAGQIKREEQ